jgi:hypothetical protein
MQGPDINWFHTFVMSSYLGRIGLEPGYKGGADGQPRGSGICSNRPVAVFLGFLSFDFSKGIRRNFEAFEYISQVRLIWARLT